MSLHKINPSELYDGSATGMSHAKLDTDTGLVFVSGQVDWNKDFQARHPDIETQTRGAAANLLMVLAEAGSGVDQILQLRVYVRGEVADHMETIVPILAEQLGTARPALTGVGVASLATPDTLIEIEAVAKTTRR